MRSLREASRWPRPPPGALELLLKAGRSDPAGLAGRVVEVVIALDLVVPVLAPLRLRLLRVPTVHAVVGGRRRVLGVQWPLLRRRRDVLMLRLKISFFLADVGGRTFDSPHFPSSVARTLELIRHWPFGRHT